MSNKIINDFNDEINKLIDDFLNDDDEEENEDNILIYCPKCKKVPKLVYKGKNKIEVICEKEKNLMNIKDFLQSYIFENDNENKKDNDNNICIEHKKKYEYICNHCPKYFCEECVKNLTLSSHIPISLEKILPTPSSINKKRRIIEIEVKKLKKLLEIFCDFLKKLSKSFKNIIEEKINFFKLKRYVINSYENNNNDNIKDSNNSYNSLLNLNEIFINTELFSENFLDFSSILPEKDIQNFKENIYAYSYPKLVEMTEIKGNIVYNIFNISAFGDIKFKEYLAIFYYDGPGEIFDISNKLNRINRINPQKNEMIYGIKVINPKYFLTYGTYLNIYYYSFDFSKILYISKIDTNSITDFNNILYINISKYNLIVADSIGDETMILFNIDDDMDNNIKYLDINKSNDLDCLDKNKKCNNDINMENNEKYKFDNNNISNLFNIKYEDLKLNDFDINNGEHRFEGYMISFISFKNNTYNILISRTYIENKKVYLLFTLLSIEENISKNKYIYKNKKNILLFDSQNKENSNSNDEMLALYQIYELNNKNILIIPIKIDINLTKFYIANTNNMEIISIIDFNNINYILNFGKNGFLYIYNFEGQKQYRYIEICEEDLLKINENIKININDVKNYKNNNNNINDNNECVNSKLTEVNGCLVEFYYGNSKLYIRKKIIDI